MKTTLLISLIMGLLVLSIGYYVTEQVDERMSAYLADEKEAYGNFAVAMRIVAVAVAIIVLVIVVFPYPHPWGCVQ